MNHRIVGELDRFRPWSTQPGAIPCLEHVLDFVAGVDLSIRREIILGPLAYLIIEFNGGITFIEQNEELYFGTLSGSEGSAKVALVVVLEVLFEDGVVSLGSKESLDLLHCMGG